MPDEPTFGAWMRARRKERGLTQERLAETVGCSWEMLRKVESGTARPSRQLAELLAAALGAPAEEVPALVARARESPPARGRPVPGVAAPGPAPLPGEPTPFIGRTHEVAQAVARLRQPGVRLLTLTGPAGIGKTRLAVRVAAALAPDFPDGTVFVSLATLRDPAHVALALAAPLAVGEAPDRPLLDALTAHLREKRLLLVLDNFEQVAAAAPLPAALLAGAPHVKLLVTSRAALRLRAEHQLPVPPLPLPDPAGAGSPEALAAVPAVALFVERAAAALPGFSLTAENAAAVAAITRRLDGLPLAIELAAAWIKILAPEALLARLEHRLALLTGGARDLPARQQTLRDAIAWSYQLLGPPDQRLFAHLAVLEGSWTLDAAEAIAGDPPPADGPDRPGAVLAGLAGLVNQSLVQRSENGRRRFRLLETIREYALEQLGTGEEATRLRDRHASHYLSRSDVEPELENVRAAWTWAITRGQWDAPARGAAGLAAVYDRRGWYREGAALFGAAVEALEARAPRSPAEALLLARLRAYQGSFCARQARLEEAQALLERSVADLRALAAAPDLAYALDRLGMVVGQRGAVGLARQYHEESLALAAATGDARGMIRAHSTLGLDASKLGQYAESRAHYAASLLLAEQTGDDAEVARTLNYLGYMLCLAGAAGEAQPLLETSLAQARALGDAGLVPYVLGSLAQAALARGDYGTARALSLESLTQARRHEDRMLQAYALVRLGEIGAATGDGAAAAAAFRDALETATAIAALPRALAALVGLAGLRLTAGDRAGARTLLHGPLHHPATEQADRVGAESLAATLGDVDATAPLPPPAAVVEGLLGHPLPAHLADLLALPRPAG